MKQHLKLIVKYLCYGISWGCTVLVLNTLIGYFVSGKSYAILIAEDYARQALGSIAVGISCGSTAVIYQFRRPSWGVKLLIHFVIGMGVFYPTAVWLGWIPFFPGHPLYTVLQLIFSCGIFMAIWLCFYLFNRRDAKKINDRLRDLERENET